MIYFDIDGVLANLELGYKNKFNAHVHEHSKSTFWKNVLKGNFFETLPVVEGAEELVLNCMSSFGRKNVGILSSFGGHKTTWEQKHLWLNCIGAFSEIPILNRVLVPSKCHKHLYRENERDILIDDRRENCADWNYAKTNVIGNRDIGKAILVENCNLSTVFAQIQSQLSM